MIRVHGVPLYWGVERDAVDRSFLTRATLDEALPPYRYSYRAIRIRVSHRSWLHVGIRDYKTEVTPWGVPVTPEDIGRWSGTQEEVQEIPPSKFDKMPEELLYSTVEASLMRSAELFRGLTHREIDQGWILAEMETQIAQAMGATQALMKRQHLNVALGTAAFSKRQQVEN